MPPFHVFSRIRSHRHKSNSLHDVHSSSSSSSVSQESRPLAPGNDLPRQVLATEGGDSVHTAIDRAAAELRTHRVPTKKPLLATQAGQLDDVAQTASILAAPVETTLVENAIHNFFESVPVLIKALDEVAKVHPFISVAVLAFKAVYTLEMKRSENDSKVIALYVEMKDMMNVLLQLTNIKDPSIVDMEGATVEGRMQGLIKQIADDIKRCANVCDVWSKMRVLARILKAPFWEGTFVGFVNTFTQRRTDLVFAMSMHTARGIDQISDKLDSMTQLMEERTKQVISFLRTYVPQAQKSMYDQVQRYGGPGAVLGEQRALEELVALSSAASQSVDAQDVAGGIQDLKKDLKDPEEAAAVNLPSFNRKLEILQRQIVDETEKIVVRESDRIIESVIAGPHDRLLDKDIYAIWKEMGWRGSVKARHFVLALRDYYHDRAEERKRKAAMFEGPHVHDPDAWCLEFITAKRLQSISEAFDDDASGFVTVTEANLFTSSRPASWSLAHWIAYWAVGWQSTAMMYREKIYETIHDMFALKPWIHPENRPVVDRYLIEMWMSLMIAVSGLQHLSLSEKVQRRFKDHVDAEEQRLKRNLETVRYRIDDLTTLSIVTGPGQIEKHLFPLLYLMLRRDLQVFRACQCNIVAEGELLDSSDNILNVIAAWRNRAQALKETFVHQGLNAEELYKTRYCGLFEFADESEEANKHLYKLNTVPVKYNDAVNMGNEEVPAISYLNHPTREPFRPEVDQYNWKQFVPTKDDIKARSPYKELLGTWHGFFGKKNENIWPSAPMFTFDLHISKHGAGFEAVGTMPDSMRGISFNISGNAETTPQGEITYVLQIRYSVRAIVLELRGNLNEGGTMLSGSWGGQTNIDVEGPFVLTRLPPKILSVRPSPWEFEENRIRALWHFALAAAEHQVLQSSYSWKFFKQRRDVRRRYVEFRKRARYSQPLSKVEKREDIELERSLSPADARFYATVAEYEILSGSCVHIGYDCDSCGGRILGSRMICLTCASVSIDTLDLCSAPDCVKAIVSLDERPDLTSPHLPSHDLCQLRKNMHPRERQQYDIQARRALRRAHAALDEMDNSEGNNDSESQELVHETLACSGCGNPVTRPCWYCAECNDDVFVCVPCDTKGGVAKGSHLATHTLVICQTRASKEAPPTLEQRIGSEVERRLENVNSRLEGLETQLARIQQMLESVLTQATTSTM